MVRSNKIDTLKDLDDLFALLNDVNPILRRSWLAAASTLLGGPPLFIQAIWSTLAMNGHLAAAAAVETYRRIATLAEDWQEPVAAVECHRAAAVMLDEYLGDNLRPGAAGSGSKASSG
jgi:hypothetical protein